MNAECEAFAWIGQPITSCDDCGRPAWDHAGRSKSGGGPFDAGVVEPWPARTIASWIHLGWIAESRACELLSVHLVSPSTVEAKP